MAKRDRDPRLEVIEYYVGATGYRNVATYDETRYIGPGQEYRQTVMANAYKRLVGPLAGKTVLDVGCGTGRGAVDFARQAKAVTGSDASADMLSLAKSKVGGHVNCTFAAAYAQHLPFPSDTFDVVTSLNFLHLFSVETQRQMIAEMKRVLKPGGTLVLEFDNALHGIWVGLYKRWFSDERGALPWEIRYVIGPGSRIVRVYGAVFPFLWRLFRHFPRFFIPIEKIAYVPPFNRLSHRIYYKIVSVNCSHA